jgi:transposase-like protein
MRSVRSESWKGMTVEAPMYLVSVGNGYLAPQRISVEVDRPRVPFNVHLEVVVEDERILCGSVTYSRRQGGVPVTAAGLGRLQVERWAREAVMLMLMRRSGPDSAEPLYADTDEDAARLTARVGSTVDLALPRRRRNTPAFRRQVAERYYAADCDGDRAVQAVARAFRVPRPTAQRWVGWCRKGGELGETQPGKQGGDLRS